MKDEHEIVDESESIDKLGRTLFFIMLALVTAAFIGLISDFLLAGFWAMVLAIIFSGVYKSILKRFKGREGLSSALTTLFIFFVVVIPVGLISIALVDESTTVVEEFQTGEFNIEEFIQNLQRKIPVSNTILSKLGISPEDLKQRINDAAVNISGMVGTMALKYTQNAINFAIQFTLMLYLLFFFLKGADDLRNTFIRVFPMNDRMEEVLLDRFVSVSRATLKGTLIVAVIQGLIGGILFASLGIRGAVFWGSVMTLLSLLPVGGSAIVWAPTAIILMIQGEITKAIIIIIVGSLIIGLIDNLLRPLLVGRDTKMPDYLVLIATLGGIAWFGLSGFIIGPVIAALFITFWQMLNDEKLLGN